MAGGGVQKIYMVFLREPSRRDRSGSDLFHLWDGFEIKMNLSADYMNRTYRWMAVGLLITFAAAFVTAATPLLYVVNSLYLVFTIAELVLVYVLSSPYWPNNC